MIIDPKEVNVLTQKGEHKTFILSKFPAIVGREIFIKYPISGIPKIGDYEVSKETMLKLMSYVHVPLEGGSTIALKTEALVNNHIPDWETLVKIEYLMLEYNGSFFTNGKVSGLLSTLMSKLPELSTKILTALSAQSSTAGKPH